MTEYAVEFQRDFLEHRAKAQPIAAVAELIWNGLDAEPLALVGDFSPHVQEVPRRAHQPVHMSVVKGTWDKRFVSSLPAIHGGDKPKDGLQFYWRSIETGFRSRLTPRSTAPGQRARYARCPAVLP